MLAARSEESLRHIASELGQNVSYVAGDVGNENDLRKVAEHTRTTFGSIAYSASKHAVKGFTDALRMELEEEQVPFRCR